MTASHDPGLPLPPAVLARLRSADTLRAEVTGLAAERDALRTELDTAAWERETAQNEAAYLRDEVLHREPSYGTVRPDIGRVLVFGDTPPEPPTDGHAEDVALVSLSTGEVYVRAGRAADTWQRYGHDTSQTDFATMCERGPWVTVGAWALRDHQAKADAARRLTSILYDAGPGLAEWPEQASHVIERIKELASARLGSRTDPAEWISAWHSAAGLTRLAWEREAKRSARLTALLAKTPHAPDWMRRADDLTCTRCLVAQPEHVSTTQATS